MKLVNKITIGIVCLLMILSTMPLPQSVSGDTKNGVNGQGGSSGGSTWAELYGYIHLEDETGTTELTDHQIRVTNNRTQCTEQIYTNQYGFYSTILYDLMYTDILTLEVSYYDPETSNNIYGITNLPVANNLRADPTFRRPLQDCIWYKDINAPPKIPPPHSDLLVGGVYFYGHEQGLEIRFTIWNIGTISASNIEIEVYDGTTLLGERYIDHIMPDEYGFNSVIWTAPSEGVHRITVTVDPRNDILEIIETNNEVTVDTDIVIEANGILHFVWENIGDGKIHYLNNIQCSWTHTQWTLSWTNNLAINPQIEIDSDRLLHVAWIEITSDGLILRYAWSYNHIYTWFDRYELSPSSPEYELNYDLIEEIISLIVEVFGEIIEQILNADPNTDPPIDPPSGPILDEPPQIEITEPEDGDTVSGTTTIYGTTTEGDHSIIGVWVQIGAESTWHLATNTSEDWSTWEYETHFSETGGAPIDIRAQVKDSAIPPNLREDHIMVYEGEESGYTYGIVVVENHIYHEAFEDEMLPYNESLYDDPYPILSPWIQYEGDWLHYHINWRSKHRIEDGDREFDIYTKSVIIKMDSWYDIEPFETDENNFGIPDLARIPSDNAYEGHRADCGGSYTQEDVDNGVDVTYEQSFPKSPPDDGTEPPQYETTYYYRATVRTQLIEYTNKTQPGGGLYRIYHRVHYNSWKDPHDDESLAVYV